MVDRAIIFLISEIKIAVMEEIKIVETLNKNIILKTKGIFLQDKISILGNS
jgi:hypothetical protein